MTESLIEMTIPKPNSWLITRIVTWIETITPPCEDITHLLSQSMDRRLLLHQRFAMWIHLTICDRCALLREHLAFIRKVSRSNLENGERISEAPLSENARRRIKDAVTRASRPDEKEKSGISGVTKSSDLC
jgi:hypothetical protein